VTPYHLLFFTQSETLTLIFLLSHHYHVVATTLYNSHRDVWPSLQLAGTAVTPSRSSWKCNHHCCTVGARKTCSSQRGALLRHLLRSSRGYHHNSTTCARDPAYVVPATRQTKLKTTGSTRTNAHQHMCQNPLIEHESLKRAPAPALAPHAGITMAAPSSLFNTLLEPPFSVCTFVFAVTFMATPCSNAKSPHSILQWQQHCDLHPQAPRATTIPDWECGPDATSPRQPRTQQYLPHQLRSHRDNHHNLAWTTHGSQMLMERERERERDYFDMWQPLNGPSKSQNWSTSQLWARAGQRWSNMLFNDNFGRRFLYMNPKWPRKERVIWQQFIVDQTVSENFKKH